MGDPRIEPPLACLSRAGKPDLIPEVGVEKGASGTATTSTGASVAVGTFAPADMVAGVDTGARAGGAGRAAGAGAGLEIMVGPVLGAGSGDDAGAERGAVVVGGAT